MSDDFSIRFLDHVAIRVSDLERSASWYTQVLGLQRYNVERWGSYPIFLLKGQTGVALFPAQIQSTNEGPGQKGIRIDHFAFRVDLKDLDKARRKYNILKMEFEEQDHFYFHSIYTRDPDGHMVELTALKVSASEFYRSDHKS